MQLEAEIHSIKKEQASMAQDISLIKQAMEYASNEKEELVKIVKSLEISINRFNLTMEKKNSVEEGKSTALKSVRVFIMLILTSITGVVLAWIFWVTNSTVANNSYIDHLKKEAEVKRGGGG